MGAATMYAMVSSWMAGAHKLNPEYAYTIRSGSRFSATGVHAWRQGRVNCVTFSREPFPSEIRQFEQRTGSGPITIPVVQGSFATPHDTFAIAIYVNRANPLRRLTIPQLREILGQRAHADPEIERWGQMGLHGVWVSRPVHVYGMAPLRASGNPPGIVNFLNIKVLQGLPWRSDLRVQRDTPHASALAAIVQGVARDPDGIGYSGIGYGLPDVVALAISRFAGQPYYLPTIGNVSSSYYPLTRTVYLGFPSNLSDANREAACNLLSFSLSEPGQAMTRYATKFNPLTPRQLAHSRRLARISLSCAHVTDPRNPPEARYTCAVDADVNTTESLPRGGVNIRPLACCKPNYIPPTRVGEREPASAR